MLSKTYFLFDFSPVYLLANFPWGFINYTSNALIQSCWSSQITELCRVKTKRSPLVAYFEFFVYEFRCINMYAYNVSIFWLCFMWFVFCFFNLMTCFSSFHISKYKFLSFCLWLPNFFSCIFYIDGHLAHF